MTTEATPEGKLESLTLSKGDDAAAAPAAAAKEEAPAAAGEVRLFVCHSRQNHRLLLLAKNKKEKEKTALTDGSRKDFLFVAERNDAFAFVFIQKAINTMLFIFCKCEMKK